jgi:hydrogenase nickel incorporation protein HypA/HybF
MHELSIALSILDVAGEAADKHGQGRVAAIHLRLGPLAGVVKEALMSAFQLAREGSPLATVDLRIEEMPLVAYCAVCAAERNVPSPLDLCCPVCGTATPEIRSGRELEIVALEVE